MLSIALSGLQTAMNQYLGLAHNRDELLAPLLGKVVAISVEGLGLTLYYFFTKQQVDILDDFPGTPDATISGSPFSLLAMKCSENQSASILGGHVTITGNTHVAQQFNEIFEQLDIDWEEHLAKIIGDPLANGIGNFFRGTKQWGQDTCDTFASNLGEYVQHEIGNFPSRHEIDDFMSDVDETRASLDRLTARVAKLQPKDNT